MRCRCARDGARVAIAAKTAEPHSKLPGTIYTAAEEIEKAGGKALPLIVDVRGAWVSFVVVIGVACDGTVRDDMIGGVQTSLALRMR